MLSRTASNLYWLARYMERAETTARLLEVGERMSLIPNTSQGYRNEWEPLLQANGTHGGFAAKYGDPVQRNIESYMFFDRDNPSSIAACISSARENGRIVRTALTTQVWDALNTAFQELKAMERKERSELPLTDLTEWTLRHCAQVRGAIDATLLRNDGYNFINIGYCLERADNTARMLDVKYFVLLPQVEFVGSGLDNYQWTTLLRGLSAHRAFHWAYGGEVTAAKIADFLVLNPQCPRSLVTCAMTAKAHLDDLATLYKVSTNAQAKAKELLDELKTLSVDEVFEEGLHEFLTRIINEIAVLGANVHEIYLSGDVR
jgi:uncharacterized alpha-E superfamily protein